MNTLRIMIIFYFLTANFVAAEVVDKIKKESKNVFKTLTRKSLDKHQTIKFISDYVIVFDDMKEDGIVVYYFEDKIYKRYKDLELISEDNWTISKLGYLKIFSNKKKNIWKIQLGKENIINIKEKMISIGKSYKFSYQDKTDYYLDLEEKKIKESIE